MLFTRFRETWLTNARANLLSGITVSLVMIPEALAFSIIAGVDPLVGVYASFCIAVITALFGGRPGMISGATGAMAVLMVTLVANHGVQYLFAATILTGLIQYIFGILRFGRFLSFIPQSVIAGFLNALAIIIFMSQLTHLSGATWGVYAMVAGTLAIIYVFPRLTKVVPSALVSIIFMTVIAVVFRLDFTAVGDIGQITRSLPVFQLPSVLFSMETLFILLPYALPLAIVGILESLLTATIVDEMTDTSSDKNKEIRGQGLANVVTGFFGGMAGCAMIGQSTVNVRSGGHGRLSTLTSGVVLLFLIMVLGDVVALIPMPALVGVMIMVAISTFNWESIRNLRSMPVSDTFVMLSTVVIVVATGNLALGVLVGVVVSAMVFGWKMAQIQVKTWMHGDSKVYRVSGQLYFASTTRFMEAFDHDEDPDHIVIDFSGSHVWDHSGVTAISKVVEKYEAAGKSVTLAGLNRDSEHILERGGVALSS